MPLALVSVYDKSGLAAFATRLAALGFRFLASGGSAAALRAAGLSVTDVSVYTNSDEMLGGRVKTLHPSIHGGILARDSPIDRAELAARGWEPIDLVVVNLYPFEETVARPGVTEAQAIEEVDIGGVTLIRAAAKNHGRVTLAADPHDYDEIAKAFEEGPCPQALRRRLAAAAFARTASYDRAIATWMAGAAGEAAEEGQATGSLPGIPERSLRYGENPHQRGEFRSAAAAVGPSGAAPGPLGGRVLAGKELSYNNILDLDAAFRAAGRFSRPACAIVKHLCPCGLALDMDAAAAFRKALASDPVSAYGGVVAFNFPVDEEAAKELGSIFLECVVAPAFSEAALAALAGKKNLRLVVADPGILAVPARELRSVTGGWLVQDTDLGDPEGTQWRCVSVRKPSEAESLALRFAWDAVREVRSNAIVLARGEATVGIGGGQTNRVDAVRQAIARAGLRAKDAVLASDAFFPFPDGVEEAGAAGVTALVHPGGSIRDAEVIAVADRLGMALLVTGVRHFRH
jgi:phosphoribosylaminoimidazolecarboxamide formyltransferase/IMP cyclohydrolase